MLELGIESRGLAPEQPADVRGTHGLVPSGSTEPKRLLAWVRVQRPVRLTSRRRERPPRDGPGQRPGEDEALGFRPATG